MAHVQIAATTQSQTANTMRQVRAMGHRDSRVAKDYKLDVGKERYNGPGGSLLEVISSSAAAAEGAEITFAVADETEHWTPNRGGYALMDVLDRNLAKSRSRLVETCNAWQPGEFSVAEATFDAWEAQQQGRTLGDSRILYDARVPADVDLADKQSLLRGLEFAFGDTGSTVPGGWAPLHNHINYILNGKTKADDARRFFLNTPWASLDAWVARPEWEALAKPARTVEDGEDIVMFFDGSKSRDATALMGCCMSDGHVFTIGVWEPDPATDETVSAIEVDLAVTRAFERCTVLGFFADVREWESFVKVSWPERFADQLLVEAVPSGKEPAPIAFDMRSNVKSFTLAAELTADEITDKQFTHDGDPRVTRHVANARRAPNSSGVSIRKESKDSPKKIDAAVCVIGARMVRRQVLNSKAYQKRLRRGVGMVVF